MCICYATHAGDILAMAESTSSASAPGTLVELVNPMNDSNYEVE